MSTWDALLLALVCFGLLFWGLYPFVAYIYEILDPPKYELSEEEKEEIRREIDMALLGMPYKPIKSEFEYEKEWTLEEIKAFIRAAERSFRLVCVFIGVGLFLMMISHLSIIDNVFPISIFEVANEKIYMTMIISGLGRFLLWFLAPLFFIFGAAHLILNEFNLYSYKKMIDKETNKNE